MKPHTTTYTRLCLLSISTSLIVFGAIACTIPPTPNPTQVQQTIDSAIQQQLTVAIQQATEAASTQQKMAITQTINAAVRATMEAPTTATAIAAMRQVALTATALTSPIFPELAETTYRDAITLMEIRNNRTTDSLRIERDIDDTWYVVSNSNPQRKKANQSIVENSLIILTTLASVTRFEDSDLRTFGLDSPQFMITLSDQAGKEYVLVIGHKSPTSSRYYAKLPDHELIYLVPQAVIDGLLQLIIEPPYDVS